MGAGASTAAVAAGEAPPSPLLAGQSLASFDSFASIDSTMLSLAESFQLRRKPSQRSVSWRSPNRPAMPAIGTVDEALDSPNFGGGALDLMDEDDWIAVEDGDDPLEVRHFPTYGPALGPLADRGVAPLPAVVPAAR